MIETEVEDVRAENSKRPDIPTRLVPLGVSACTLMIAVDYLLSGSWSGTPYYILAAVTLALAAKLRTRTQSRKSRLPKD